MPLRHINALKIYLAIPRFQKYSICLRLRQREIDVRQNDSWQMFRALQQMIQCGSVLSHKNETLNQLTCLNRVKLLLDVSDACLKGRSGFRANISSNLLGYLAVSKCCYILCTYMPDIIFLMPS